MRLGRAVRVGKRVPAKRSRSEFGQISQPLGAIFGLTVMCGEGVAGPGAVVSWARCPGRRARWRCPKSSRGLSWARLGGSKRAFGGRGQKMEPFARSPQSGCSGVEEQGSWLCLIAYSLSVYLGTHRAGLVLNQTGRWLTGSPGGADGEVLVIFVNPGVDVEASEESWSRLQSKDRIRSF